MSVTAAGEFAAVVWTPSGPRVLCNAWPETDRLLLYDLTGQLLDSTVIPGVSALHYTRAAASPDGHIAWIAQATTPFGDRPVMGDATASSIGTSTIIPITAFGQSGVNVAWFSGQFVFYVLVSGTRYVTVSALGTIGLPIPAPKPTSQGWIDVWDGNLRWSDQYRDDPAQGLLYPTTQGGVTLGQNRGQPDYVAGLSPSGRFEAAPVLGMEPSLCMAPDGLSWAACWRQLHGQIGMALLPPFPPVVTVSEPPRLPTFTATTQRVGIAIVGDSQGGPDWASVLDPVGPRTVAIFHPIVGWLETKNAAGVIVRRPVTPAESLDYAEKHHLRCFAYDDGWDAIDPSTVPPRMDVALQCYTKADGVESLEAYRDRIIRRLASVNPIRDRAALHVVLRATVPAGFTLQAVLDKMPVGWDLTCDFTAAAQWYFCDQRADGINAHPELRTAIDRNRAASADWQHFPTFTPTPEPPVETDPPMKLPDVNDPEFVAAITAIAAEADPILHAGCSPYIREVAADFVRDGYMPSAKELIDAGIARQIAVGQGLGRDLSLQAIAGAVYLQRYR